jgi:hypothetical protein
MANLDCQLGWSWVNHASASLWGHFQRWFYHGGFDIITGLIHWWIQKLDRLLTLLKPFLPPPPPIFQQLLIHILISSTFTGSMFYDITDALPFSSFPSFLSSIEKFHYCKHVLHMSLHMIMFVFMYMIIFCTVGIHQETPLNIDLVTNNKRQDCKIGTVRGEGEWRRLR